jgi:N-acetylmuramoyl-L-alanine amidase
MLFSDNYFVKSEIKNGELRLYFSSDIKAVKYFTIPLDNGYKKFVYDIYGAVLPNGKGISHHTYKSIKSFKIAQNNKERVRVVLVSKEKTLDKHAYRGNLLVIPLISGKLASIEGKTIENIETRVPKYTIVIDPGHGGKDNGASCCGKRVEKRLVLSVAKKLKRRLKNMGYRVYMTRDRDVFVKLPKRTEFANRRRADIFVSIHANASPSMKRAKLFRGIEVYYLSPASSKRAKEAAQKENSVMLEDKDYYTKNAFLSILNREKIIESHKLGLDIKRSLLDSIRSNYIGVDDGGVKSANFWVLVGAQMPAVLVELGYITHPKEGKHLVNSYYQELLAEGIAKGIKRYLDNNK